MSIIGDKQDSGLIALKNIKYILNIQILDPLKNKSQNSIFNM